MAKDPAFLFYPNDWMGGTMGWTFEEKGAYLELLLMQFNRGHMTTHMIGHVLGQNGGQLWVTIQTKFEIDAEGKFFNKRLEEEQNKRKAFTDSRKNNIKGKNQYSKKEKNKGHMDGHMTSHMENENENENENNTLISIDRDKNNKRTYIGEYTGQENPDQENEPQVISKWEAEVKDNIIDLFPERCRPTTPKQLNTWAATYRKLIEIDGYTPQQVDYVIRWAREDPFWQSNFLSLLKLREKDRQGIKYMEVFIHRIKSQNEQSQRYNGKGGVTDRELARIIADKFAVPVPGN